LKSRTGTRLISSEQLGGETTEAKPPKRLILYDCIPSPCGVTQNQAGIVEDAQFTSDAGNQPQSQLSIGVVDERGNNKLIYKLKPDTLLDSCMRDNVYKRATRRLR
jgi:hypothetical protein